MRKIIILLLGVLAMSANAEAATYVTLNTNYGSIVLELDEEKAPVTVKNFVNYVEAGFYEGTVFHRVIDGFMIQGGGVTIDFVEKDTEDPIKNEASNGLKNHRGTIAMARTMDPDSATAQFFINTVDNFFLDYRGDAPDEIGYAVFGKVIEGMDVVDKISKVKTISYRGVPDVPVKPVEILDAKVTFKD